MQGQIECQDPVDDDETREAGGLVAQFCQLAAYGTGKRIVQQHDNYVVSGRTELIDRIENILGLLAAIERNDSQGRLHLCSEVRNGMGIVRAVARGWFDGHLKHVFLFMRQGSHF